MWGGRSLLHPATGHLHIVIFLLGALQQFQYTEATSQPRGMLHHLRATYQGEMTIGELRSREFYPSMNMAMSGGHTVNWRGLARGAALSAAIAVVLVTASCLFAKLASFCGRRMEGKEAEPMKFMGPLKKEAHAEGDSSERWSTIEQKMQKQEVASVEAVDYQQLLKALAQKVALEKGAKQSQVPWAPQALALKSMLARTFRFNEMNPKGTVLPSMQSQEAMHWLQLEPAKFRG